MSAIQALITFITTVSDARHHNEELHVCYLDFAKAFDSIPHRMLIQALRYYGSQRT